MMSVVVPHQGGALAGLTTALEEQEIVNDDDGRWGIVRVIPTAEQQIPCHGKNCSKNAAVSWASNKNSNQYMDLCEDCQVNEFRGWPEGVDPIKTLEDAEKEKITKNRKQPPVLFPARLYDMLDRANEEGYSHLISWCEDGTSFQIQRSCDDKIVSILKHKFNQTRYKSFLRQLQVYGFVRHHNGAHKGVYRHPFFVRHHCELFDHKSLEDF